MKFQDFGFKKFINDSIETLKFNKPTKIQEQVIPLIKKHQSVVAVAHTGTGKSHSFLFPIINNIDPEKNKIQAVIIVPTRELANQLYSNIKTILKHNTSITAAIYIGGTDSEKQIDRLDKFQPNIIIGTPTRLKQLYESNNLKLTTTDFVIIDEFDMFFELGFIEEVDFLLSKMSKNTNISLFSATMKNELKPFLKKYLKKSILIEMNDEMPTNKNIEHVLIMTKNKENKEVLHNLIKEIDPYIGLIFVNKKTMVSEITGWLEDYGVKNVGELHGDLNPRTRTIMQKRIQNMEFKWIVVTDVAARGIDIDGVTHVISIDLPFDLDYYIHRSGRTGRGNYTGKSYVLFNSANQKLVEDLKAKKVEFTLLKMEREGLTQIEDKKPRKKYNKDRPISKTEIKTQKVINKFKQKKVKPGYKRQMNAEIDKIKKEARRQNIKESIKRIKKERYTKRRKELFED